MKKKIGILGGMGPAATLYLFKQIIDFTEVKKDQDHITTIIYSNPATPDRTAAILGKGPSPLPHLIDGTAYLKKAGADFILIPCVTAHHFLPQMHESVDFVCISLLEETLKACVNHPGDLKRIGLIATDGTIETRLFQDLFESTGLQLVFPAAREQDMIMDAIYETDGIKNGDIEGGKKRLLQVAQHLKQHQADAIIAGCSEIPLALIQGDMDIPLINPIQIVAKEAIGRAGYPIKNYN